MAFPNTKPFLPLLSTITIFLMLLCRANSSPPDNFTDFTFDSFDKSTKGQLIFQGDANISSSNTIQLTKTYDNGNPKKNSVGRVLFADPVHLWDNSTGQYSSFETTFKSVITSPTREIAGDGITFFMAPVNTTIPEDSDGGFFGLFSNNTLPSNVDGINSTYQILYVEFDNYVDSRWDPNYKHIGINVNTVRSRATIPWDRVSGSELTTTISYNTNNKILYVTSSYSDGYEYAVSSAVDLNVLPEHVRVGFSASTGDSAVETHNLISWTFSAWLHNVTAPVPTKLGKHAPLYSA